MVASNLCFLLYNLSVLSRQHGISKLSAPEKESLVIRQKQFRPSAANIVLEHLFTFMIYVVSLSLTLGFLVGLLRLLSPQRP